MSKADPKPWRKGLPNKNEPKQVSKLPPTTPEDLTVENWQRLVHSVCQTNFAYAWNPGHGRRGINYMDLFQEGVMGLQDAIERYDHDHDSGAGFATYAWRCIYTTIASFVDQNLTPITTSRWRSVQDGSETIREKLATATACRLFTEMKPEGNDDYASFEDGIPDPESCKHVRQLERKDLLKLAIERLREMFGDENVDMLLAYYAGATYSELGEIAGTSYETIRKRIKRLQIAAFGALSDMEDDLYETYVS